jgi:hypothetical protein
MSENEPVTQNVGAAGDGEETCLLAEAALSIDWNRQEEDAAWAHLQAEQ